MEKALILFFLCLCFEAVPVLTLENVRVLVFPLDGSLKTTAFAWTNEGIALSISQQLAIPGITVIGRKERVDLVEGIYLPPGAPLSHASMIRVAQRAPADFLVMGKLTGTQQNVSISLRALDIRAMKLTEELVVRGPITTLPQMENELAWMVLGKIGAAKTFSKEKFREKIRKTPNSAYACFIQSLSASNEKDRLQLLLKSVASYRAFPEAQSQLGGIFFRKGDCSNAMAHLTLSHSDEKPDVAYEFMRGTCYLQEDLPSKAIDSFSHLLLFSRSAEVLNNMGVAYLRKGDFGLALNSLLEAKNLARTDATVDLNLAIVRHMQGNDWAARNTLEDTIKTHPRNGMLQFLLGYLLRVQGDNEKAAIALSKAKTLGVNVERLQTEDPKNWAQINFNWEPIASSRRGEADSRDRSEIQTIYPNASR
jgi:Flp pilus assembly protein TadD